MALFARLLKALNSEAAPWQIALAIVLGMIIGLTPLVSVHNLLILFLVLVLRVNLAAFLASWAGFSVLALAIDPLMMMLGDSLLSAPSLQSIWTTLYNQQWARLMQFNNTLTLGSLVISLLIAPVLFVVSRLLVVQYRQRVMVYVNKLKIVQAFKASKIFSIYQKLEG